MEAPHLRIIVCQASYGDTLGIEIDNNPPKSYSTQDRLKSPSRQFMLIDGGPATVKPTGTIGEERIPLQNMYKMLQNLVPVGSRGLNTLVVTHDDADHIFGIAHLLKLLNSGKPSRLWPQGTIEVSNKRPPFARVWHNSVETVVENFGLDQGPREKYREEQKTKEELRKQAKEKERDEQRASDDSPKRKRSKSPKKDRIKKRDDSRDGRKKRGGNASDDSRDGRKKRDGNASSDESESDDDGPGYFDKALRKLAHHVPANHLPKFNEEFQNSVKLPQHKNLVVADGMTPSTSRGHVTFNILGPGPKELKKLVKYFTKHGNTRGSVRNVSEDEINEGLPAQEPATSISKLGEDLKSKLTNDPSAKNLSSIVFEAVVSDFTKVWSGLFTGDASACKIFRDWDGKPKNYDLIKIGHHGSCYNNFFGNTLMRKAKNAEAGTNLPTESLAWKPSEDKLREIFTEDVAKANGKSVSLSNVLGYFCNIRARNYVISASHDKHPNPHLGTLIGIIARAVYFPPSNGEPVRIYLTNPIAQNAWERLLTYWYKVAEWEYDPRTVSSTTRSQIQGGGFWKYEEKRDLPILNDLLNAETVGKLMQTRSGQAIFGLIADMAGGNGLFQIYYLRPDRSYGVLRADRPSIDIRETMDADKEHEADWELIHVQDTLTNSYLAKNYTDHFAILKSSPSLPTLPQDHAWGVRPGEKGQQVISAIPLMTGPPPNTPSTTDSEQSVTETAMFYNMTGVSPMFTFTPKDTGKFNNSQLGSDINIETGRKEQNGNFSAMMFSQGVPIINTARVTPLNAVAIPPLPDIESPEIESCTLGLPVALETLSAIETPATRATTVSERFPVASEPNIEAFRRFGLDYFDIPPGDDFAAMAQIKIKNIRCYAELLAYLAENNKLTAEDAINAGTIGGIDGYATLGALTYLTLGIHTAGLVLGTLPLESPDVLLLDDQVRNPMRWPVELLNASVLDTSILDKYCEGASGIQQLAMRIFPQTYQKEYVWAVPNKATLLGKGEFRITLKSCIDITIFWPTDPKRRIVHGSFCGELPTSKAKTHSVICEWLIMPDESRPVVYHVRFSNAEFVTAGHEMSIVDMLSALEGVSVDLALTLADAVLPGLVDRERPLGNNIKFTEPGLTISRNFRHSQALGLHGVFGKFSIEGVDDWKPFSQNIGKPGLEGFIGKIQIRMPSIRLCLQDLFDPKGPRVFFRINHSIRMGNSDLAYELETREARHGERLFEFTFRPVTVDTEQPLTLMRLLTMFGLDALSEEDVPKFIMDALNGISLTCFRLGWAGELSVRLPDYLEIGVRVERLSIASDLLNLDNVCIRLRIDNPLKKEKRNVYLQSGGVIRLVGVEAMGRLTYGVHPLYAAVVPGGASPVFGPVDLSIGTTDTPLTLGNVLDHFWPGSDIIPEPFNKVTDEVGLTEFRFRTGYSEARKKQVVKMVKLGMGITSTQVEIMEGMSLIEPTLDFTVYNPFDQAFRTFMIKFGAMVMIDEYSVSVNVGVAAGKSLAFAMAMSAGGGGLPVGALIRFAQRKMRSGTLYPNQTFNIDYPKNSGLEVLDETEIQDFTLVVGKGENGKYGISEFSIHALSDLHLDIWYSVKLRLERVTLQAEYGSERGFNFTFGSEFYIGDHVLRATMGYDRLPSGGFGDSAGPGAGGGEKGWFVKAEYADEIDLLAIAKRLMGIEMAHSINDTKMEKLKTDKGIIMSKLSVALQHADSGGSIYISADTDWAVFKHIQLAATYSGTNSWGFCLYMALQNNLLSLIPVECVKKFSEWIEVNDATIALYIGKVDTAKAGLTNPKLPPPPGSRRVAPLSSTQAELAVSATIKMTEKFGVIKEWVAKGELELEGHISTQSVGMSAKIPTQVKLGKRDERTGIHDLEIAGSFGFDIEAGAIKLGLYATMKIHCPAVTEDIIEVQNAGLIINSASGIGIEGRIDGPLRKVFGLEGLEARGLSLIGVFSLAQSGLPEQLALSGGLKLAETNSSGEVSFHFAQRDVTNCYFYGRLANIDIAALVNFALKKNGLPAVAEQFLSGNMVIHNLALEAALSDIEVPQLNKSVKRGFYYEAEIWIKAGSYQWAGYTCVQVRLDGLQFIAMMSPISFSVESQTFFRLTRGSTVPPDVILPKKHSELYTDGPVIYISSKNPEVWLFISVHLVLLSIDFEITARGDSSGFELDVPRADVYLDLTPIEVAGNFSASLRGKARIKPREQARAELMIDLTLKVDLPTVTMTGLNNLNIKLPSNLVSAGFHLNYNFNIGWPGSGDDSFSLNLSAEVHALGQRFDLVRIAVNLHPRDLDTVDKVVAAVVREFLRQFPSLLTDVLSAKGLSEAGEFLKTQFGQTGDDLLRAVAIITGANPEDAVDRLGREFFGLIGPDASRGLMKVLGEVHGTAKAMEIAASKFVDMLPGFNNTGSVRIPFVDNPIRIPLPDFIPSFRLFGIERGPNVVAPMSTVRVYRVDENGNEIAEEDTPQVETEAEQNDLGESISMQAPELGSEPEVLRVEVVREGQGTVVEEWTQEQVAECVRAQRIALIRLSLEVFELDEVLEATRSLFADLSEEQLLEYIIEANEDKARESQI